MFGKPMCNLNDFKCVVQLNQLNIEEFRKKIKHNTQVAHYKFQNHKEITVNMLKKPIDSVGKSQRRSKRIKTKDDELERCKVIKEEGDEDYRDEKDMEDEYEIINVKKDKTLSSYEKMILKNQEEKHAFLQSLKIEEAKAGFIESVNIIKKTPTRVQKRPQIKKIIPSAPIVLRKSRRLAKMDVINLSEEALVLAVEEENKKVIPPVLPFEEALQFKDLYEDFLKDFEFLNGINKKTKALIYDKDVFGRMVIEESRIAKVVPHRITALAVHPTCEKIIVCAGSKYGHIGLWNVESDTNPYVCGLHYEGITNLQFNPANLNQLMSSSYDGIVRLGDFEAKIFSEVYNISMETRCTYFDFLSPVTFLVAQNNGKVALVDNRSEGKKSENQHQCHDCSVRTVHVHPVEKYYFITAGYKGAVRVWDLRKLQHKPVAFTGHHRRCVRSAYFSPVTGNSVLTSSIDDTMGIFDSSVLSDELTIKKSLKHNNCTGRWITVFRPTWIPHSDDAFVTGSMLYPRRIEVFNSKGYCVHNFIDENLATITSCNVFHPFQPVLAAGNSSGKVYVFKELLT